VAPWHPRIHPEDNSVVYLSMDWDCPADNTVASTQLSKYYGSITPEVLISDVFPIVKTGDLHSNVYDLTNSVLYTANARGQQDNQTSPFNGYNRQYVQVNLQPLWNKKYGE